MRAAAVLIAAVAGVANAACLQCHGEVFPHGVVLRIEGTFGARAVIEGWSIEPIETLGTGSVFILHRGDRRLYLIEADGRRRVFLPADAGRPNPHNVMR